MGYAKAVALKEGYHKLKLGMSRDEVISLFGEPQSQRIKDGTETLGWWNREYRGLIRGGSLERRVVVEIEDDKVIGFDGENVDASTW